MKVFILSGGSGTRLFPLSRDSYPKQFLKIFDGESLIQKTFKRALKLTNSVEDIVFITNKDYFFHVKSDIEAITNSKNIYIIKEPIKRNTAPAIALGVSFILDNNLADLSEPVIVLPADHIIYPEEEFVEYAKKASEIAQEGYIVMFGIKPTKPETGYGYIEIDHSQKIKDGYRVKKFHEKPSLEDAKIYIEKGTFFWNSGIFCFTPEIFLQELKTHSQDIYEKIHECSYQEILSNFEQMPDISVDYALMEKTDKSAIIPIDIKWSDVGSFEAIYDVLDKDENKNAVIGDAIAFNSQNNLIISEKGFIATLSVQDLIIVQTDDVLVVAKRGEGQKIKDIVNTLKKIEDKKVYTQSHTTDYRPWGKFTLLDKGDRFKIKKITVNPGEGLSLQMHYHRSEHWVVVKGTALVVMEDENGNLKEKFIRENESFFIPKTTKHRLINPGKIPLEIIEVQVGEYVGEDDIVRFDDRYNRC